MADVIKKSTNKFTKGLIMDFSPENTKNEVLTHALNATLLTFNGNELSLQNDMGNARVETAYLPDGYMPVGTCEYGGIIYIVSYNPLEDKSQIGCFPSPERNISSDELGRDNEKIDRTAFLKYENGSPTGDIVNTSLYVLLKNDNLNPGDKFIVCSENAIYGERLKDLLVNDPSSGNSDFNPVSDPVIALNIVSIEDSGKIVYLNSDTKLYTVPHSFSQNGSQKTYNYKYHILGEMAQKGDAYEQSSVDIDKYRNVLDSGYSVFKSKTSGKLAILAELIMIDSYAVTHSLVPKVENGNIVEGCFDIVIHTEVSPEITSENYNTVPKLQYYFLKNSLGYIQKFDGNVSLFDENKANTNFAGVSLKEIYEPITLSEDDLNVSLESSGQFNFPRPETYHGNMASGGGTFNGDSSSYSSTKFSEGKFHRIKHSQIEDNISYYLNLLNAKFYYYDSNKTEYQEFKDVIINESYTYYIEKTKTVYTNAKRDESNKSETLYKLVSIPQQATKDEIVDKLVEKFAYVEVNKFIPATLEDITNGASLWVKVENGYSEYKLEPEADGEYYIKVVENTLVSIGFDVKEETVKGDVYYFPTTMNYEQATQEDLDIYWNFDEYPYDSQEDKAYGCPITLYYKDIIKEYVPATQNELLNYKELNIVLYYDTSYVDITKSIRDFNDSLGQLFIVVPIDTFVPQSKFVPNTSYNYIEGNQKPSGDYPKDEPISLYTLSNFIPGNLTQETSYLGYQDIKLATIKIPRVVFVNGLDLPFKYDYTLVPCMNYGRLDHLAVSNTVDFSKLHAFNQSDFNTWKYRIDDNQLRLTFGADIYDTYETDKVDGLILEFYDIWGFAGSLEIIDKKSYSGIFTKIISLNTLNALSKKKVDGNGYSETFRRNINIIKTETGFLLNDKPVEYRGFANGWKYTDLSLISDEDNDCGVLYSNMVYGVKAYLRRDSKAGKEFIKKQEFFLYTLPIFNDYYYTVSNFNNLANPELKLMLTYRMEDSSVKMPYIDDNIKDGYTLQDKENITQYLSGFYNDTSLDVIRYYKYSGISKLYLEIGLLKDYEELNLSYDPAINEYFSCSLQLISDDSSETSFTVNSEKNDLLDPNQILNYYDANNNLNIDMDINELKFLDTTENGILSISNLNSYRFLYQIPTSYIAISYNFIVGYKASVLDIRTTQVPATTVCALCHKTPEGEYNYEDLGVYEQIKEEGESTSSYLLSSMLFYNSGDSSKEIFGLGRMVDIGTGNIESEINSFHSEVSDPIPTQTAGKLNSGEPLKLNVQYLGKLTFCLPYSPVINSVYGVNIESNQEHSITYIRDVTKETRTNQFQLMPGQNGLHQYPLYSLSLNTKNAIVYNSEFITTLDYDITEDWLYDKQTFVRLFTGFNAQQVSVFNQKMINTMKNVYAYNPDYDSLLVNVGDITLQNYNPYFTSNIISTNSDLLFIDDLTFNDFIYIGGYKFSEYLNYLNEHSRSLLDYNDGININVELVKLKPDFTYCGTNTNPYLISSLTYNTPVPSDLEQELEFSASDNIVVKTEDGTNHFLKGTPNKKTLYGYNLDYNKLILLDVSNYTIDNNGNLSLKTSGILETEELILDLNESLISELFDSNGKSKTITKTLTFNGTEGNPTELQIKLSVSGRNLRYQGGNKIYATAQKFSNVYGIYLNFNVKPTNTSDYTYKVNTVQWEGNVKMKGVRKDPHFPSQYYLSTLSNEDFDKLILDTVDNITVEDKNENAITISNRAAWVFSDASQHIIQTSHNLSGSIYPNSEEFSIKNVGNHNWNIGYFEPLRLHIKITRESSLAVTPASVISTTRTNKYSKYVGRSYTVLDAYKKARLLGTTITLNDLIYEPNKDGHRLFMRNNLCKYDDFANPKIYYRKISEKNEPDWSLDTERLNALFVFVGPSFIDANLNGNDE